MSRTSDASAVYMPTSSTPQAIPQTSGAFATIPMGSSSTFGPIGSQSSGSVRTVGRSNR